MERNDMVLRPHAAILVAAIGLTFGCTQDPRLPECAAGQVPQQTADGWRCADLPEPTAVNTLATAELACSDGQLPLFVGGAWTCGAATSASGGDIDAVIAGAGLTGGAETGSATLAVSFGGGGAATTAARSDHAHAFTSLTGVPPGFLDLVDNDAIGSLACGMEQVPRFNATRAAWECWTPPAAQTFVEMDPTVNSLARAGTIEGCGTGQTPVRTASGWSCQTITDRDALAALGCADGQVPRFNVGLNAWQCAAYPQAAVAVASVSGGAGITATTDAGVATVAVNFNGACASNRVACSDDIVAPVTPSLSMVLAMGSSANGNTISGLGAPTGASDAVTKGYVDALTGAGGAATASLALCCGSECINRMPGWNCDQVAPNGSLTIPLPDARGMVLVPAVGNPRMLAAGTSADGGSADVSLGACATNWQVCTQTGFSSVMVSCGAFSSSGDPNPWLCTAPPKAYIVVPGVKGMVYLDGTDAANEYLRDDGQSYAPAAIIDCSGAAALPGPGTKTAACFR